MTPPLLWLQEPLDRLSNTRGKRGREQPCPRGCPHSASWKWDAELAQTGCSGPQRNSHLLPYKVLEKPGGGVPARATDIMLPGPGGVGEPRRPYL